MLAYSKADFLFVKEFETGGKFLVAWTRRASNPYPKVFCVLTSVCVTRNDEEASAPTFILAINNPTENYVRTQAVFLPTASFSLDPLQPSAHHSSIQLYHRPDMGTVESGGPLDRKGSREMAAILQISLDFSGLV